MARRVLVIAPAGTPEAALRKTIAEEPAPVELRVVSPASDLSFTQWLANAEDDARDEAEETARRAADALADEVAVVESGAGDTDPVVAAQDALRTFPADELVVVLPDGEEGRDATWLERAAVPGLERLGLPVRYVRASGSRAWCGFEKTPGGKRKGHAYQCRHSQRARRARRPTHRALERALAGSRR